MGDLETAESKVDDRENGFGSKKSLPLSFRQKRLWFLDRLISGKSVYRNIQVIRLKGRFDVRAFEQSWNEALKRQPFLCCDFPVLEGQPIQRARSFSETALPLEDLQGLDPLEREAQIQKRIQEENRRPLDLERDPVWRMLLLRLGPEEHVWILVIHPIASDHRSFGVLFREVSSFYQKFCRKTVLSEAGPRPIPAAIWRNESDPKKCLDEIACWKQKLAGVPEVLELPSDRVRPAARSFAGASRSVVLDPKLSQSLQNLSKREGVALPVLLLASFTLLLHRYTFQEDVVLGASFDDWAPAEAEELVGPFTNMLVFRSDFSQGGSFKEFLSRSHQTLKEACRHRMLPFERLVEEIRGGRNLDHAPLVQVKFSFEDDPLQGLALEGVEASSMEVALETSEFDQDWVFQEREGKLYVRSRFNTDLFDRERMDRMLEHFQVLLAGIAACPDELVSKLPLLTSEERNQTMVEWNHTARNYPDNQCLHQLFESQVERTPDVTAVISGETSLTYRELNSRANRLAHRLMAAGVGPEKLVAICTDRSSDMVVGLMAILKAGGAYVPLDLSYPADRLGFIFEDAGVSVLLTQKRCLEHLPRSKVRTICMDATGSFMSQSETNPETEVASSNLAYVIYTSGSTGRPKGVAIEHRSPVTFVRWAREVFAPDELAGVLASTSVCFDLSVFEIFVPLSWGGSVILAENALQLPLLKAAQKVILINTVPSAMAELIRMRGVPSSVRTINLAGEALSDTLVRQIYQIPGIQRVNDLYGPTEDTVYSTFACRTPDGPTTIGRPISNTQVYLLDRHLQPVPIGVPGELHLSGDGLARGYLNRPELTAEKFISNPWNEKPGARLYKTGDLVRYRRDGNLEYLGRIDHQVKIRGFRIELGEIETRLRQHRRIRECRVMAREDSPGEKKLVAYLVAHGEPPPPSQDLRHFLKQLLPEYMIPSAFVWLKEFPLTPNGKVDRKALPPLDRSGLEREDEYIAPRNDMESDLAAIWEEVLGIEKIGSQDNFFDLGGHSLLAVRLFERIERKFGKRLPLGTLFQAPTIERLAEVLCNQDSISTSSLLVGIQTIGSKPPLFWVHTLGGDGGGGFFYYRKLAQLLGSDQPSYGIRAREEPFTQIEEMASHYIAELQMLQSQGPYYLGGFCFGGNVAFEMARQLTMKGHKVALLALLECPLNGTTRWSWDLLSMGGYARQFRQWLQALRKLHPEERHLRIQRKIKTLLKGVQGLVGLRRGEAAEAPSFREVVDLSKYPKQYVRHAEIHWQALMSYVPKAYSGRITLFRAHTTSAPKRDIAWGWDSIAQGGVAVKWIPGSHETMFVEPHVYSLAEHLKACLVEAQRSEGCPGPKSVSES